MEKIYAGTKKLVLSKQGSLFTSTIVVSATIIISSLFGFMRYRILAGYFKKEELDIFFAAFRIPDLIFEILITGALTSSFIPIFIKYQKDQKALTINISSIINIVFLSMLTLSLVIFATADWLIPLITPGFSGEKIHMIIFYSRLLLIGQLPFLVLSNMLTGIGQANKTFVISSLAPIVYNIAVIASTIWFSSSMHLMSPFIGVVIGAVLMFLMQLPLFYTSGYKYRPVITLSKGVVQFFRTMVPRVTTVLAAQIDATIDLSLTSVLGSGAYTIFYFAQRLQLLPISIIGIAFGQASLPYLTEVYQRRDHEEFKRMVTQAILSILYITIPISSFLIFARTPVVRFFFGGEKFDWEGTVMTAKTLTYFALAVPIHSIYYFITRCFYAFFDSRSPFYVSVFSIITNTLLSLYFIYVLHLQVWSLALSFSIAMTVNVLILLVILQRKVTSLAYVFLITQIIKILIATFIASFCVYCEMKLLDGLILDTSRTINILFLLIITSLSYLILYVLLSWTLGIHGSDDIRRMIQKARTYKKRIIEIYNNVE